MVSFEGPATIVLVIGRIAIEPALNPAEHEYLLAFAESRRWLRPDGPYAVPGNPAAEPMLIDLHLGLDRYSEPATGQPSLDCTWRPSTDGRSLVPHTGADARIRASPAEVVDWLAYLRDHFLPPAGTVPGMAAEHDACDTAHRLDGGAAVCRQDGTALTVIRVRQSRIDTESIT